MKSREEEVMAESKHTLEVPVPTKKPKAKPAASPRKAKQGSKGKEKMKENEKKEDSVAEIDIKAEAAAKKKTKQERGGGLKSRDLVVGECREEKAPYVSVREAKMVTLSEKVSRASG